MPLLIIPFGLASPLTAEKMRQQVSTAEEVVADVRPKPSLMPLCTDVHLLGRLKALISILFMVEPEGKKVIKAPPDAAALEKKCFRLSTSTAEGGEELLCLL